MAAAPVRSEILTGCQRSFSRDPMTMRLKISHKLFFSFLAILVLVIATVLISRELFIRNFKNYIHQIEYERLRELVPEVEQHYRKERNWDSVRENPQSWRKVLDIGKKVRNLLPPPPPDRDLREADLPAVVLLDRDKSILLGDGDYLDRSHLLAVTVDGEVVGWLGIGRPEMREKKNKEPMEWLQRQNKQLLLVAAIVLTLTGLIALLVSKHLLKSIWALNEGAKALAERRFGTQVEVFAGDELGQLAQSFNKLSRTLARYETMRQQWLSDISHELRTPLAILRGEIEALLDGIRKPSAENLGSLHVEVVRLNKLVEDLHQLTLDDSSYLKMTEISIDPGEVISMAVDEYRSRFSQAGIYCELSLRFPPYVRIKGDVDRLIQVFRNIFENCCRYVGSGGQVKIGAVTTASELQICIDDSGPGVPDESLHRLFDRLYRVDTSRDRDSGGSGLGLSICRAIIEAHGGFISALPGALGGLRLFIRLPLQGEVCLREQGKIPG